MDWIASLFFNKGILIHFPCFQSFSPFFINYFYLQTLYHFSWSSFFLSEISWFQEISWKVASLLKERIQSIDNEERQKLSLLSLLILSFSAILIKDVPEWERIACVKSKDYMFKYTIHMLCQGSFSATCTIVHKCGKLPKSEIVFWKEFIIITEKWKTNMPPKL